MAGKVMELALKIKGQLDSSCTAAMRSVAEKANDMQNNFSNLTKATKTLHTALNDPPKMVHRSTLVNREVMI